MEMFSWMVCTASEHVLSVREHVVALESWVEGTDEEVVHVTG